MVLAVLTAFPAGQPPDLLHALFALLFGIALNTLAAYCGLTLILFFLGWTRPSPGRDVVPPQRPPRDPLPCNPGNDPRQR